MGTRSRVGVQLASGTVRSMYVHWDGYPGGVGAVLLQHYNTDALAEELVTLGYASSLEPTRAETYDGSVAHNRDSVPPLEHAESAAMYVSADQWTCEYVYLRRGGQWEYAAVEGMRPHWQALTPQAVSQ